MGPLSQKRLPLKATTGQGVASARRPRASAFFIERIMQRRHRFRLKELPQPLAVQLIFIIEENWGWLQEKTPY